MKAYFTGPERWTVKREEQRLIDDCRFGYTEEVAKALDAGVNINVWDSDGWAPLHIACLHGYADLVRLLIEKGADANVRTMNEWVHTPLHIACRYNGVPAVRLLLEKGADPNVRDKDGRTPLDLTLSYRPDNPAREEIIGLFSKYAPDLVMEIWCTMEVRP